MMVLLVRNHVPTAIVTMLLVWMVSWTESFCPLIQTRLHPASSYAASSSSSSSLALWPYSHRRNQNTNPTKSSSSAIHLFPASMATLVQSYSTVGVASVSATTKLLTSIGLGCIAAKRPQILDEAAISALSRLTYWIFQPAFLFCNVSRTLANSTTGSGLARSLLWMLPLVSTIHIALGAIVAKLLTKNMNEAEARDVTMCTTFVNAGPLPLMYTDALFKGTLQSDVASCICFYLISWSPLFWSYGKVIVGTYGKNSKAMDSSSTVSSRVLQEIRKFISPPMMGSLLGLVVGSIPFLRKAFLGGFATPLYSACNNLGIAYLPAAILILAGSLVQRQPLSTSSDEGAPPRVSSKALGAILLSRYILMPLLSLGIFLGMDYFHLLGSGRSRALVSYVILMEGCMPSNQNSVIMMQLDGLKDRAGVMARILTILYTISVIPVTILLSGCLALSGILKYA